MVSKPRLQLQLQLQLRTNTSILSVTPITKIPTPSSPSTSTSTSTWIDQFRNIDRNKAETWFWDHFNWNSQSLWIGKLNTHNHLPSTDNEVIGFMKKLITDLNNYPSLRERIYIKMYFSRNVKSKEPDINYLLVCNSPVLPPDLACSLVGIVFEKYQITEKITSKNANFKDMINHYINWNNFYNYHDLKGEIAF